jgi:hypothetical protein
MFVNTAGGKVMLNGVATVTTADIIASNGVVHGDKVIGLPTIVTHALQIHLLFSWCFNRSRSTRFCDYFIRNRTIYRICSTNAALQL